MPDNLSVFTRCAPHSDMPGGYFAIASLTPRFMAEYFNRHEGDLCLKEIFRYAELALAHAMHSNWWIEDINEFCSPISKIFVDQIDASKILVTNHQSTYCMCEQMSISDTALFFHEAAARSKKYLSRYKPSHTDNAFAMLFTSIAVMSTTDNQNLFTHNNIYANNIKAGIVASLGEYPERSMSFVQSSRSIKDTDYESEVYLGHILIFERCVYAPA